MDIALAIAVGLIGYGYMKTSESTKDVNGEEVKENYVMKNRESTKRRMAGTNPGNDEEVAYAADDFQSRKSVYTIPKFVSPNAPDPGWQNHPIDKMTNPSLIKPAFYENLQHFTSEAWDTWDGAIALRNPNESFRGDHSEIGTVRLTIPKSHTKQPFAF